VTNEMNPGGEYSNNLALNKSYFFFQSSYEHFFPSDESDDIYSGDYVYNLGDSSITRFRYIDQENYPFLHTTDSTDVLSPYFSKDNTPPNIVILLVEGLGRAFSNKGAYLGSFTPFIDSLSDHSLYWENFLSEGGRTFAVLPSLLSSAPFGKNGFGELGDAMPKHLSILNVLKKNGYNTSFYYGGDAKFDNMDPFLQKNAIDAINDEKTYPAGYTKMPASASGFSWGYGDKELFRRYFETKQPAGQPYASVVLTVSTHNPFLINEQSRYLQSVEERMSVLQFDETKKQQYRNYKMQYASILYMNDAVQEFISQYKKRPDFKNTVFIITGDHRMPEIPMITKIDRYHVPMLIYSPLLKRTAKFSSVSTHFDIAPSLLAWLKNGYGFQVPDTVSWMGSGLDTSRQFRNIHSYPIMQTKNDLVDFVAGGYLLNGGNLYKLDAKMGLDPVVDKDKERQMKSLFKRFKARNNAFTKNPQLVPGSILQKYTP
jgi:phosphoglycerol transferase MdoB-like AlkP superfamily enzyme